MIIKTADDWWNYLDSNWKEIKEIFHQFLPRNEMRNNLDEILETLKKNRDSEMSIYISEAWVETDEENVNTVLDDLCADSSMLIEKDNE